VVSPRQEALGKAAATIAAYACETCEFIICSPEERMARAMKHLVPPLYSTLQRGNVHTVELGLKIKRSRLSSLNRQAIVNNVTARTVVRSNQPLIVVKWRCLPRAPVVLHRATSTYPLSNTQLEDRYS
jgi:hypothetical protein